MGLPPQHVLDLSTSFCDSLAYEMEGGYEMEGEPTAAMTSALGEDAEETAARHVAEDVPAELVESAGKMSLQSPRPDPPVDEPSADDRKASLGDAETKEEQELAEARSALEQFRKELADAHDLMKTQHYKEMSQAPVPMPEFTGKGVALFFDVRMSEHRNLGGDHPEQPARILRIFEKLELDGLAQRCLRVPCREANREQLELKHTASHVDAMLKVQTLTEDEAFMEGQRYNSLYLCPESTQAALLSAGSVVEAVRHVCAGQVESAACVVRPPGHHAECDRAMGFCLFGNVGVAVAEARKRGWSKRTLIVDWDVHHGNGTQRMFDEDDTVLFFSIHRHDSGRFYPASAFGDFTSHGVGGGVGYSVNVPWDVRKGLDRGHVGAPGDVEYLEAVSQVLLPIASDFKPDLVVISAGFDSALGDPLGECRVTPEGFHQLTRMLMTLADGRMVIALEGGYNLDSISVSMAACVRALLGEPPPEPEERPVLPFYAATIENVRAHHAQFWPSLRREDEEGLKPIPAVHVPAAALRKGSGLGEMEQAMTESSVDTGVPLEDIRRKQQTIVFQLEDMPERSSTASAARKELKQLIGRGVVDPPYLLPVVRIVTPDQTVRNVGIALQAGAHGVWLLNAGHAHSPASAALEGQPGPQRTGLKTAGGPAGKAGRAQLNALKECFEAVREHFSDAWIGLAIPQLPAAAVFKWVSSNCPEADAVWIDEIPCKPADVIWETPEEQPDVGQRRAVRLEKWLTDAQPALKALSREKKSGSWLGLVFGGVASKTQDLIHHEQESNNLGEACQALLQHWSSLATTACDVVVTGKRVADSPFPTSKVRALAGNAQTALLMSGASLPDSASLRAVDAVLVEADVDGADFDRDALRALQTAMRLAVGGVIDSSQDADSGAQKPA